VPVETTIRAATGTLEEAGSRLLAVPQGVLPGFDLPVDPAELLEMHEAKGEAGEIIVTPVRLGSGLAELLFYGVGDGSERALRKAGAALARRAKGFETLAVQAPEGDLTAFAEGALLAAYDFTLKSGEPKKPVGEIVLVGADQAALDRALITVRAVALARDLANTTSNYKCPAWLAEQAQALDLDVRVWDEEQL
jgi:leucyl aminopeptidase